MHYTCFLKRVNTNLIACSFKSGGHYFLSNIVMSDSEDIDFASSEPRLNNRLTKSSTTRSESVFGDFESGISSAPQVGDRQRDRFIRDNPHAFEVSPGGRDV